MEGTTLDTIISKTNNNKKELLTSNTSYLHLTAAPVEWSTIISYLSHRTNIYNENSVEESLSAFSNSNFSAERTYPHIFDESENGGKARNLIQRALREANNALDAFNEPNMDEVLSRLHVVSVILGNAHKLIDFNPSLGAVIGYIRRATLITSIESVTRSSLNSLISAIQETISNLMLDLDDATNITEKLSTEGWLGNLESVREIIHAIINSNDDEDLQSDLFIDSLSLER